VLLVFWLSSGSYTEVASACQDFMLNDVSLLAKLNNVRFEVFTAVTMKNGVFWVKQVLYSTERIRGW
jgi:hypothetical protein